jgi:hypothetical protein
MIFLRILSFNELRNVVKRILLCLAFPFMDQCCTAFFLAHLSTKFYGVYRYSLSAAPQSIAACHLQAKHRKLGKYTDAATHQDNINLISVWRKDIICQLFHYCALFMRNEGSG